MHRTVERMLRTNPEPPFAPLDALAATIHACMEASQVCSACADACLGERLMGRLEACIRLNLDCADICNTTSRILTRQQNPDLALVAMMIELCAAACEACAHECERHAEHHAHCHVAAAACHRCFDACRSMMTGHPTDYVAH
ncbi:MAG: four-helix bundle copper-binding protein [Deltaproteobacteria bacterium]|nr:four-helix bundle copper-binding protein [Deltaproteobacteria bacterium]